MLTALISGATSGIGKATAQLFAQKKFSRLVLCGRRQERLSTIARELSSEVEVHTLCFDISDRVETEEAVESLPQDFKNINILVNNAGNAYGLDLIQEGKVSDWEQMIDINIKGVLYLTKQLLPMMLTLEHKHIINIGSISGFDPYPRGNVYCATKAAVNMLSRGMLMDLNEEEVRVSCINPGLAHTEFSEVRFKGDTDRASQVYADVEPLYAEDIASAVHYVASAPSHVNVSELTMMCTAQASSMIVHRKPSI